MFDYLGRIVDMVAERPGADFFKRHANELGWMLFITVIARPILVGLHNLLVNQAIITRPEQPLALADAQLRGATEPELLPERLRRQRRQPGDADRYLAA